MLRVTTNRIITILAPGSESPIRRRSRMDCWERYSAIARQRCERAEGSYYDRVLSTLSFELDEQTFLFDSNPTLFYGDPSRGQRSDDELTVQPTVYGTRGDAPGADSAGRDTTTQSRRTWTPREIRSASPSLAVSQAFCNSTRTSRRPTRIRFPFGIQRELKGNVVVGSELFRQTGPAD